MAKMIFRVIRPKAITRWTEEEHELIVNAVGKHGTKCWHKISAIVKSKTFTQCRSHYQKFEQRIKAELGEFIDTGMFLNLEEYNLLPIENSVAAQDANPA